MDNFESKYKELNEKAKRVLENSADNQEGLKVGFQHAVLCQLGMPRKFTEGRSFERRSGSSSLLIEAGNLWSGSNWIEQPLPYGAKPRLILMHLMTQAIRTKSPIVDVGNSIRQFLTILEIDPNGRNYAMFKAQLEALAACQLKIGITSLTSVKTINTQPIKSFEAWLHPTKRQEIIWPGEIEISQEFFESLSEHAVPVPYEAMHKLKDSALDLDVFSWLTHRLCRVDKKGGVLVPWTALKIQFGQEYKEMKGFKRKFKTSLRYALASYLDANISEENNGLRLYPSKPPISKCQIFLSNPLNCK